MVINAIYSDGTVVAVDDYNVSGFDSATAGVKTLTIEYAGYKKQFDVVVINGTPIITVEKIDSRIGETVDVSILIENNPGIAGVQFELEYDERLTLSSIVKPTGEGCALEGLDFTVPGDLTQNTLVLPLDGVDADNTNGKFLTLTFVVPEDAVIGDQYFINVSCDNGSIYDENLNDVECEIVNGKISVGYILGDVNNDGNINVQDVITLRRGVAGGYDITLNQAADVNGDGIYNIKDITLLRRYIVGGYGVEL